MYILLAVILVLLTGALAQEWRAYHRRQRTMRAVAGPSLEITSSQEYRRSQPFTRPRRLGAPPRPEVVRQSMYNDTPLFGTDLFATAPHHHHHHHDSSTYDSSHHHHHHHHDSTDFSSSHDTDCSSYDSSGDCSSDD